MPTTYTHWRFGQECIDVLPDELKKIVNDHRDLYDIGVHGPDIFFYDQLHKDVPHMLRKRMSRLPKNSLTTPL